MRNLAKFSKPSQSTSSEDNRRFGLLMEIHFKMFAKCLDTPLESQGFKHRLADGFSTGQYSYRQLREKTSFN